MEKDAEIHSQAPGIQLKRGRREYMGKGGQDHDGEIYRDSWTKLVETQELKTDSCGASMGLN